MNYYVPSPHLGGFESIHVEELILRPSPEHLQLAGHVHHVSSLIIEDLHDFQVTEELFTVMDSLSNLSLLRCTLGDATEGFGGNFGDLSVLRLQDINQDLVPLLCFWNGHNLQVSNCPRFDDSVLDMMSSVENRDPICAPFAHTLYIRDCPNFSFSALRRLVEYRLHLPPDFGDPFDPIPTRFRHLYVSGSVPSLSAQDRAWFASNVSTFFCGR
jgi:hypothetical protein